MIENQLHLTPEQQIMVETFGPNTPPGLDVVLKARGSKYGDFCDNAEIAQYLKQYWRATPNWSILSRVQREALDLIALKLSRILTEDADAEYKDNWVDIAGYAQLVVNSLSGVDAP